MTATITLIFCFPHLEKSSLPKHHLWPSLIFSACILLTPFSYGTCGVCCLVQRRQSLHFWCKEQQWGIWLLANSLCKRKKKRGEGWIKSVHIESDFLWAHCWEKPIALNRVWLVKAECTLILPHACILCRDDKFQSIAWRIYFHGTSLLPRLRNKATGPSLPVTLEVLHLLYIWWNSENLLDVAERNKGKLKHSLEK